MNHEAIRQGAEEIRRRVEALEHPADVLAHAVFDLHHAIGKIPEAERAEEIAGLHPPVRELVGVCETAFQAWIGGRE